MWVSTGREIVLCSAKPGGREIRNNALIEPILCVDPQMDLWHNTTNQNSEDGNE